MSRNWSHDILGVLRGAQAVVNATLKLQEAEYKKIWDNSSIKSLVEDVTRSVSSGINQNVKQDNQNDLSRNLMETVERTSMVYEGLKAYVKFAGGYKLTPESLSHEFKKPDFKFVDHHLTESTNTGTIKTRATDFSKAENSSGSDQFTGEPKKQKLSESDKNHEDEDKCNATAKIMEMQTPLKQQSVQHEVPSAKVKYKTKQTLSDTAKQRKVPASRIARMVSFGSLAAGLGIGTVAEVTRRSLGITQEQPSVGQSLSSAFLSEANAERIVDTLCKVRGAALKLGQMLSIQDSTIISPTLQKAFERVRQSADFMPTWQVEKVLESELGKDWRSKVTTFEPKPFAAASIGQVHLAVLPDETEVAMKIQYPGVAKGIESDIDNLVGIMKIWNIFPEGLFIDNVVEVAKRELAWEVDYERELQCTKRFKELLKPYPDYYVPRVIDELSSKQIFATELVEGIPVDKCVDLELKDREHIGRLILNLCLLELFEFQYMQTDPNWSNFFYNTESKKLILLDFGASRPYSNKFIDIYIQIIRGAADGDREKVLQKSREIGFFSGYESKIMEEAHVDAVMILGEVFQKSEAFDFGGQDTTRRIQQLVPTMVKHRLRSPPEEIYSLHRKLSGVFLLLAKLKVKVECKSLFERVYNNYKNR